jgi:thiol-disulfide isomerase/thioredoxin
MKKTNFLFATLLSLIFASCGGNNNEQPATPEANVEQTEQAAPAPVVYENNYLVKVGDIAPDFTLKLTDGSDFTLSKNRGKVVMLQFTASWCGVCRKEMPFIEKDI